MSGSRSRRSSKLAADATRDDKPAASRTTPEATHRRVAVVAKEPKDADSAALRSEIRALKRALAAAEEKANDADARRTRAVNRATVTLRRENESLEAQLTLLVQEIGQIKHLIDRVPRLEGDLRTTELQLAEREQAWRAERARLEAEIEKLSGRAGRSRTGIKTALAASAAPRAGARAERTR